jgi:hypothetical protein
MLFLALLLTSGTFAYTYDLPPLNNYIYNIVERAQFNAGLVLLFIMDEHTSRC